jgi:hypothetical protein
MKTTIPQPALEAIHCAAEILLEASSRLHIPVRDLLYWHDVAEDGAVPEEDRMDVARAVGTIIGVALATGMSPQQVWRAAKPQAEAVLRAQREVAGADATAMACPSDR